MISVEVDVFGVANLTLPTSASLQVVVDSLAIQQNIK
jgi:hypothetical protein